ncbi:MAG: sulfatase/phosphatase domain-containing protein, partial [Planctomycetota bacterium]
TYVDALIGRLLDRLDELGLDDNTVVILWGDHGWKLGEHNSWCKQTNYEIDTRSPLIIRAPHAKANGRSTDALVEFIDIFPTLCELAGLPIPEHLEGVSLVPLLEDPENTVKDAAFSQFPRRHDRGEYHGYTIRTDRYRYVEWVDTRTGRTHATELYDHRNDPDENTNVAAYPAHQTLITELQQQLFQNFKRHAMQKP